MRTKRGNLFLFGSIFGLALIGIFAPILSQSGVSLPLCQIPKVSAQDNPCLDREVTISAQEVQILQLQATMNVQEIANLQLENRNHALEATITAFQLAPPNRIIITVPVLVTATRGPATTDPERVIAATLSPTSVSAEVEIVRVLNPGDINTEGVDILNNGAVLDLAGWTLISSSGETYTIPQQRIFTGGVLTIYTRVGTDTPSAKFWGLDNTMWASGDTVTLIDPSGYIQAVYEIP